MNNEDSTIRSLHELKTLFDSGAITAEEYESLKKRIIYGNTPTGPAAASQIAPAGNPVNSTSNQTINPVGTQVIYPRPNATSEPVITPPAVPPIIDTPVYEDQPDEPELAKAGVKKTDWFLITLAVLGVLLLVGLLAYQFLSKKDSERLTSKSGPETEDVIPADATNEVAVADPAETTSDRADRIAGTDSSAIGQPVTPPETENTIAAPAAPVATAAGMLNDKNEIIRKATEQLNAYYNDLQAPPFNASNYFAPQVERYYTLSNTTPAVINDNINSYHFPEFQNGQTSIEAGSMEVVNIGNDTYEVTYIENGSAIRKSKNQKQETKAGVRIKFNPDFKMTYLRQERVLENKLTDITESSGDQ